MAHFDNLRTALRAGADASSRAKLALASAIYSHAWFRPVGFPPLQWVSGEAGFWVRYRNLGEGTNGRILRVALRPSDLNSDLQSFYETGCGDCYLLPRSFQPEVVIDGGANIGLFTLLALTVWPHCRVIACEPDPRNLQLLRRHLQENGLDAEIVPGCLGGQPGAMTFYCREANQGSFDAGRPYSAKLEVPVTTLSEVCATVGERRCLVKLDIEGAEIEVLKEFLSEPRPNFYIAGELHDQERHKDEFLGLMRHAGWQAAFIADHGDCLLFHAQAAIYQ